VYKRVLPRKCETFRANADLLKDHAVVVKPLKSISQLEKGGLGDNIVSHNIAKFKKGTKGSQNSLRNISFNGRKIYLFTCETNGIYYEDHLS
jgi:hypothetical protein